MSPPSGAAGGSTDSGSPADTSPFTYLEKAREEYDAGRIVTAVSFLDRFREHFPSGSDEAWWLYGQCYEANSPARDVLAALDYYRRLLQEYPQSGRSDEARRRILYLERYYINIR
jgi:outer membrane protein assembly factor BamD (BamD/ComL family)